MSKSIDQVLLLPGESGWEIWSAAPGAEFALQSATTVEPAGELTDLPPGDVVLMFPVKSVTAVPMRVTSEDDALFPDLAAMHAERLGLRPDPLAGQLTDVFVIAREPENSALVSILLRTPGDDEIPSRGPKGFDISPRALAVPGDALAVWKEFGRWVFAIYHQGKLVYCQATSGTSASPDEALAREIRLALIQLSMQGLEIVPARVVVWSATADLDTSAFSAVLGTPVEVSARPAPVLPDPLSKLLPADVRAARRQALKRRNIMLGLGAVAAVYVALIGWFAYGLWRDSSATTRLLAEAKAAAPEAQEYADHIARWDELADAVQLPNSPVEILKDIALCIPPNSGLRLTTAEVSSSSVKLKGEAGKFETVNAFSLKLGKSPELSRFHWQLPEPSQSTRGWDFVYAGELPVENAPQ